MAASIIKNFGKRRAYEQSDDDIRELERYIKDFSMFLPLPVCLVTPTKIIVDINQAFTDLTGYLSLDIIGQPVSTLFENSRKTDDLFLDLAGHGRIDNREINIRKKKGKIVPVSLSAATRHDRDGNLEGYFFAWSDMSEFKKLQNSLEDKVRERTHELEEMQKILIKALDEAKGAKAKVEKERNKTAAIIANFVDPVIVIDNKERIIFANPAAVKMFILPAKISGRKLPLADGRFFCSAFRGLFKVAYRSKVLQNDAAGNPVLEELIVKTGRAKSKNSPFRTAIQDLAEAQAVYKVITAPVRDERGVGFGIMKIFYDLTREKMVDLLKSEFISIAAHQLRTPLSAIKWSLRMTLDGDAGKLNPEQEKILLKGYVSNERIIGLINEMLNVSRIEEGKFGLEFLPEDAALVVEELTSEFRSQIKVKNIKFSFKKPSFALNALIDREKFKLALRHLIENAIKYTPEYGTVAVEVKTGQSFLSIRVEDNGVGIPAAEQAKLYSKFFRAENVVRMQTEGSGLGLFIVKNIIDKHGGRIMCRSREGKGTQFMIRLPLAPATARARPDVGQDPAR